MTPPALLFDMDGVLVDTSDSYDQAIVATVARLGGGVVSFDDIFTLRRQGGFNNDWLCSAKLLELRGKPTDYDRVITVFQDLYFGGGAGLIQRERWLLPPAALAKLAAQAPLGIVTGRDRQAAQFTLDKEGAGAYFKVVVTADDVALDKPDPAGIRQALATLQTQSAWYLGDSIDDYQAAQQAGIPFIGVLPPRHARRDSLRQMFRSLAVTTILDDIQSIEDFLSCVA